MKWVPKISYGSGPTVLTLTYPVKIWTPRVQSVGGRAVSDAGVPESYVIRRDQLLDLSLRFTETEWVAIDTWLAFAQGAQAFDFWLDNTDNTTKYTVYLDKPEPGNGEIAPTRETFIGCFYIPITLRTTAGGRFTTTAL
jgi:hypothetical protein